MKSRVISLGASVIALTFAAAAPAGAQDLGGLKGQTEVKVGGPAGSVTAGGNVKVPVTVPSKGAVERIAKADPKAVAKGGGRPQATVEAKRRSGDEGSEAVIDWDGGTGVSAYADHRRKGVLEVESLVRTHGNRADGTVAAFARGAGSARAHGRGKLATSGRPTARAERSIRRHARPVVVNDRLPSAGGRHEGRSPLQAIGREVGNPIQLSLAGWLLVLSGAGLGAVSRVVRRLHRVS